MNERLIYAIAKEIYDWQQNNPVFIFSERGLAYMIRKVIAREVVEPSTIRDTATVEITFTIQDGWNIKQIK